MVFKSFRVIVFTKVTLLCLTIIAGFLAYRIFPLVAVLFVVLLIYQVNLLIRFIEVSNRDLKRFLDSVRYSDFSQSFTGESLGPTFAGLRESFSEVISEFRKQRKEKEEQYQYLQTVLKHIGVGFISYDEQGKIEMINSAALTLLGRDNLIWINQLNSVHPQFEFILTNLESNRNFLLEIDEQNVIKQLSLNSTGFIITGRKIKLVTLQNITGELERERMTREFEISRNIQIKLIPQKFPEIPGYDICSFCNPAKEVGGDYYDFSIPGKDKIGFIIGDVSGKGLPASIYMTLCKGVFQSYSDGNPSPKEVLTKMNNSIHKMIEKGVFVTMYYAVLNYEKDELLFCRAGHNPMFFFNSTANHFVKFKPSGLAIGLSSQERFYSFLDEEKIKMNSGDYLMLFTDGLTEAKNSLGEFYGEERLENIFLKNSGVDAQSLIEAVKNDVKLFVQESEQYDDITIIVIKKLTGVDER